MKKFLQIALLLVTLPSCFAQTAVVINGGKTVAGGTFVCNPVVENAMAPIASPLGGTFSTGQSVTLTDTTPGSTIYYTTDGTTPTTGSAVYTTPISVPSGTVTIKAIAAAPGYNNSAVTSDTYTIAPALATPAATPPAGTYSSAQSVSLSGTGTICYTTNGLTPSASMPGTCDSGSTPYASAITVSSSLTLKAIATQTGHTNSLVLSAGYVITTGGTVATPTISPDGGAFWVPQTPVITAVTGGSLSCFTMDGSTPTACTSSNPTTGGTAFVAPACTVTVNTVAEITADFQGGASAGQNICIDAGTYFVTSTITPSSHGTLANWITFTSHNGPVKIVCSGCGSDIFKLTPGPSYFPYPTGTYIQVQGIWFDSGQPVSSYVNAYAAFQFNGVANWRFYYDTFTNFGGSGVSTVYSDYIDIEHGVFWRNGYGVGWASAVGLGLWENCDSITTGSFPYCGRGGTFDGFHNIVANTIAVGSFDNSVHHSDGNGFISDDGGETDTNDPRMLTVNNVAYGNGGRGFQCDWCSNYWAINNTSVLNGLDQNQADAQNGEFSNQQGNNVYYINNLAQTYNSHNGFVFFTPVFGTQRCVDNYYYGGGVYSNQCAGGTGLTLQNPNFISPTSIASPPITNGTGSQYLNALPPSSGLSNHVWVSSAITCEDPTTESALTTNMRTQLAAFMATDFDGIVRPSGNIACGAFQYQSGTLLYGSGPPVISSNYTFSYGGFLTGYTPSSLGSAAFSFSP